MKTKERLVNDQGLVLFAQLIRDARTQAEGLTFIKGPFREAYFQNFTVFHLFM